MQTQKEIEKITNYLIKNLEGLQKTGPRTLLYKDEVDTIFVYFTDNNMTIIHDGDNVCHNMDMTLINPQIVLDTDFTEEEIEDIMNEVYLQPILHRF